MKTRYLIITLFLISNLANAQSLQRPVIKIKPFRYAIAWNPNLGVEAQINSSRFTISQEVTYILRLRTSPFWNRYPLFYWTNGIQTITGCRFYFDRNLKYPRGHYFLLQAGYTYTYTKSQDHYSNVGYMYTANTTTKYPEINLAIGKQILVYNRLSIDFLVGLNTILCHQRKLHILMSYDNRDLIGTDIIKSTGTYINMFCSFNIGILLVKNKDNTKIKGNT